MEVNIEKACELLESGQVMALPTETVYGLAASLSHTDAIDRIFTLKRRSRSNPLIVHVADSSQVKYYSRNIPDGFDQLAQTFWPGPLTMVIPVEPDWVPTSVRAGLPTVAFRVPSHPQTLQVISKVGPVVMPSANISGRPSSTHPEHVEGDFGANFPVLYAGGTTRGVESTIVTHRNGRWEVVRLGAISPEEFTPLLGYEPNFIRPTDLDNPVCPGQLLRHYAPKAKLILTYAVPEDGSGTLVGFSDRYYPESYNLMSLGPVTDPQKMAENLYSVLRELDVEGVDRAWVDMNFPREGLWRTVAERLKTASVDQEL